MNFDSQDITIVSKHANVTRIEAEAVLIEAKGDLTRAIILWTTK